MWKLYVNWYPTSLSPFQRDASYVPRRSIMKADAACPTAESLTGPSPGSDMDGGVLLCQLVEGVSTFSHREQEFHYFVSAGRRERHAVRAGPWLPPPNIFEIRRGGKVSSVMRQDNALGCKKSKF